MGRPGLGARTRRWVQQDRDQFRTESQQVGWVAWFVGCLVASVVVLAVLSLLAALGRPVWGLASVLERLSTMTLRDRLPVLGLVPLAACGGSAVGAEDVSRVSFRPASEVQQLAVAEGVLGGDPATGCLWFERDGERTPLVVEHDSAHLDVEATPAVVHDGDEVWGELGQDVQPGGGHADLAAAVPECVGGGAPFVADLVRASPRPPR